MHRRWAMTICTLEGYSQRGGLSQAGTRAAPPTPTSALLFSHPLLIPQPITFNSVPGTSKPGKGHRVQWRLGDLLEPARLSWVRQRGASRCWLRRLCSFPGRLPPRFSHPSRSYLPSFSPADEWAATPGLRLGTRFSARGRWSGASARSAPSQTGAHK